MCLPHSLIHTHTWLCSAWSVCVSCALAHEKNIMHNRKQNKSLIIALCKWVFIIRHLYVFFHLQLFSHGTKLFTLFSKLYTTFPKMTFHFIVGDTFDDVRKKYKLHTVKNVWSLQPSWFLHFSVHVGLVWQYFCSLPSNALWVSRWYMRYQEHSLHPQYCATSVLRVTWN